MMAYEVLGTYGSHNTPSTIYCRTERSGLTWYCVDDSLNVNATYEDVRDGVDVEALCDVDTATAREPITSLEMLQAFLDDDE